MDEQNQQGYSKDKILTEVQRLLQSIEYQLEEPHIPKEFMGKPDFYGKRRDGEASHEVCGVIKHEIKEIPRAVTQLWTMKRQLGEDISYIIVLPPLNEGDLVNLMRADKNKILKKIRREQFQIWQCNPEEKSICSMFGVARDNVLTQRLKFKDLEIYDVVSSGGRK